METIKFTCQKCGEHRHEEVMTGVTVTPKPTGDKGSMDNCHPVERLVR